MREREEEVRKINQGMHQVNEIYKVRWCGFGSKVTITTELGLTQSLNNSYF